MCLFSQLNKNEIIIMKYRVELLDVKPVKNWNNKLSEINRQENKLFHAIK